MTPRVPVTVVAGRWGAGKSGVIDRLMGDVPQGSVLLCDGFAAHHHEGAEVVAVEHEVLHASVGCPCCAVRTDLVEAMGDLLDRRRTPPHVVIEAVAGSDLAVIAQTFLRTARLREEAAVQALVTVVDGHALGTALGDHPHGGLEGIDLDAVAMSDLVVVNRLDRLVPATEQRAAWTVWSLAGSGQMHVDGTTRRADALARRILELPGFDLARGDGPRPSPRAERVLADDPHLPLRKVTITVEGALDRARLDDWIGDLHARCGNHLLRWRASFAVAGRSRVWRGQGVRTSVDVDDGPDRAGRATSWLQLVGRVPPAAELEAELQAVRVA
jgi:G3E family GTPase